MITLHDLKIYYAIDPSLDWWFDNAMLFDAIKGH